MAFSKNDLVLILPLKKKGRVAGILRSGRYQVAAGSLVVECREGELCPAEEKPKRWAQHAGPAERGVALAGPRRTGETRPLDLHGRSVAESLPLVEQAVSDAVLSDLTRIEIVHGIGTGKVKAAVHACLTSLKAVKRFELAPSNPGTTIVYL
jgi:DNA mismatch repair protein MutS2